MVRYYSGDINGQLWLQDTNDADHFGVEGQSKQLYYYFDTDDLPAVEEGIKKALNELGEDIYKTINHIDRMNKGKILGTECFANLSHLLPFDFKQPWDSPYNEKILTDKQRLYARVSMGIQIKEHIERHEWCEFEVDIT